MDLTLKLQVRDDVTKQHPGPIMDVALIFRRDSECDVRDGLDREWGS